MLASMSGRGDCCDHAVAERFFAMLAFELTMKNALRTRAEARCAIFGYIKMW